MSEALPCGCVRCDDHAEPVESDAANFARLARVDWVVAEFDRWSKLHAMTRIVDADEMSALALINCCDAFGFRVEIPGVLSRMTLPRCSKCCDATGLPEGVGSPKNDPDCRRILGLDQEDQ